MATAHSAGQGRSTASYRLRLSSVQAVRKRARAMTSCGGTHRVQNSKPGQNQASRIPLISSSKNQRLARNAVIVVGRDPLEGVSPRAGGERVKHRYHLSES